MRRVSRVGVARGLLGLMWVWLAVTSFTSVGGRILSGHLAGHVLLGGVGAGVSPALLGAFVGGLQLATGVLLFLPDRLGSVRRIGGALSAGLAVVPITLLVTNPVWMDSLGGFPAIGSGQGLLKYASAVGLSLYLVGVDDGRPGLQRWGMHLTVAGLILPLLWIGAMKFTLPEAQGIQGLLASSPFFSWMGAVFSVQGASNVIGASELVIVAFLLTYWVRPSWAAVGGALGVGTFLATLSFLVTAPGWHPERGAPFLSGSGVFLVKDLALLSASLVVIVAAWEARTGRGQSTESQGA